MAMFDLFRANTSRMRCVYWASTTNEAIYKSYESTLMTQDTVDTTMKSLKF